jgi:diguanylate cyclase (GGDEF)-like protein
MAGLRNPIFTMIHQELVNFLEFAGKDPSRLIFEDELTNIYNRRFLLHYFQHKISWTNLRDDPVSLIMMDVDNFKQVNDTYGHQVGDQVLVWIADLLQEAAVDVGMPVRYAGDEFMILLMRHDRRAAIQIGKRFIEKVRSDTLRPEGCDTDLNITVSIGVASAPEDAQSSKELIQKADIALYYAKKIGRNCLVNAGEVIQEAVFAKTAINQLDDVKLVGRGQQLARITEALNKFSRHKNQFLIAEGPAGIGKSEFLETIRRNLARINIWRIKVNGDPQEMFRPYYLFTRILVELLKQHPEKGASAIDSLIPVERAYLAQIIPQLGSKFMLPKDLSQSSHRQFIFTALHAFFQKLVGERPIILFIDDIEFADEATLILFRQLMRQLKAAIFICGSSAIISNDRAAETKIPLQRFCATYRDELGIQKLKLTPLSEADIAKHIRCIFPTASLPENFEKRLAQISQGNPLFLSEILRKLVQEHKISLVGHQWVVEPFEDKDLPTSIEEMVSEKISALDEESRQILDHVSAFGEDVSLSVLTGSSNQQEARVLEAIDHAAKQGLISSKFQLNDEVIRFLGKRILSATYDAIETEHKQHLHERIGTYQASLYDQQVLPAASTLVYHFKRSADPIKAEAYETAQAVTDARNFDPQEAVYYTVETPHDVAIAEEPLKSEDFALIPKYLRLLMVAVRNIRLYPHGSKSIVNANKQLKAVIDKVLRKNDTLNVLRSNHAILINGQKLNVSDYKMIADSFLQFLNRFELQGIAFHKGVGERELVNLLQAFGKTRQERFDPDHWQRFVAEKRLKHIDLKQTHYAMKMKSRGLLLNQATATSAGTPVTPMVAPPIPQRSMDTNDLRQIPEILRSLIGVYKSFKLYSPKSDTVSTALDDLMKKMHRFFHRQPVLSLSRTSNTLLINGEKIGISDVTDFSGIQVGLLKFLDDVGIESLTFLKQVTIQQMKTFFGELVNIPAGSADDNIWKQISQRKQLSGILFNQHVFEIQVAQNMADLPSGLVGAPEEVAILGAFAEQEVSTKSFKALLADFPQRIEQMFLNGDQSGIEQTTGEMFAKLPECRASDRLKTIDACRQMFDDLDLAFQKQFIRIFADPLLSAMAQEEEPKIVALTATLLVRLVTRLVSFGDFSLASRIIANLQKRYRSLKEDKDERALILSHSLERGLGPQTQNILIEDLKSDDAAKQHQAAQLLGSLGTGAMPWLIDVIKKEDNYRTRHTAATLLRNLGPSAVDRLRRLLILEISAEERRRILDIIDTLTTDVRNEVLFAMGDQNPDVRQAAYSLAERLNDESIADLLMEFAKNHAGELAVGAIKCIGKLRPNGAEAELVALLNSSKDDQLCIACCQVLGQIADPGSTEPLARVLLPKRTFFMRTWRNPQLRAAAAFALGQIHHPRADEYLALYADDRDPRVREIARRGLNTDPSITA